MNSKGIKAITDHDICMKCLTNKATHVYHVRDRGYGSEFDEDDTKFQCCDKCNNEMYLEWFTEKVAKADGETVLFEQYQYEHNILALLHSLPLETQELFFNTFNKTESYKVDGQTWIDDYLENK